MPILNSNGKYNIGRDITVVLQAPAPYGKIQLDNIMSFESKQETDTVKVKRLDGLVLTGELPVGWSGSFELERGSNILDVFFAGVESDWFNTGVVNINQLYLYIIETDLSQSTWAFDNVALKMSDAGSWKSDASVRVKVDFIANRRRAV